MSKRNIYHSPQCTHTFCLEQHLCTGSDKSKDPKIHDEISTNPLYGRGFTHWNDDETLDNTP